MAATVARHAYASLAVSAKLHKMLDRVGERQMRAHAAAVERFDASMAAAMASLPGDLPADDAGAASPMHVRLRELALIERDLDDLEAAYASLRDSVPSALVERFDSLFVSLKEKIGEKSGEKMPGKGF